MSERTKTAQPGADRRQTPAPTSRRSAWAGRRAAVRSLLLLASMLVAGMAVGGPAERQHLFDIERSTNRNIVRYDLRVDKKGRYDVRDPIDAYWVVVERKGVRSELSLIEKRAYGYKVLRGATLKSLPLQLVAAENRKITVRAEGDKYRAEAIIDGQPSVLKKLYVKVRDSLPLPRVQYVDVHGVSLKTGKPTVERLEP